MTTPRTTTHSRRTTETAINLTLSLDGDGSADIATGLGFLDHMLIALARHAELTLQLTCDGDLHIDDHHTVEDCGLVLGEALDRCLGDRCGVCRFGSAYAPLDESLARAVIDLSGRPHATIDLALTRDRIGDVATENLGHFFSSFATAARCCVHLDVLRGENDHHKAEAAFKAFALALRQAVTVRDPAGGVPSTKGTL
jgi:imidazoleglycerol phosphate dehydratase HisB